MTETNSWINKLGAFAKAFILPFIKPYARKIVNEFADDAIAKIENILTSQAIKTETKVDDILYANLISTIKNVKKQQLNKYL